MARYFRNSRVGETDDVASITCRDNPFYSIARDIVFRKKFFKQVFSNGVLFDPLVGTLEGYRLDLDTGTYVRLEPDPLGRILLGREPVDGQRFGDDFPRGHARVQG